jgi:uncharacterized repeat protein (TIGR03803 family)
MRALRAHFPMSRATTLALYVVISGCASQVVQAQKFEVLHAFHGPDGQNPLGLVRDAKGNLYGETQAGGDFTLGTVFKLDPSGKRLWMRSFDSYNGSGPRGSLLRDAAGDLFGITFNGGGYCKTYQQTGCGTIFKLDDNGKKETLLHKFTGGRDGGDPANVVPALDSAGNVYGTTNYGGNGCGVVFKVDQNRKETVLYTFNCGADGKYPISGVIRDLAGNLYGTTADGGDVHCFNTGCGTVYKVDSKGKETVLYDFETGTGGWLPLNNLIMDPAGNLYGTTIAGGTGDCFGFGCGTVFKLSPNSDGTWTETALYIFCSKTNCADGGVPNGPLLRDKSGTFYGTTIVGGNSPCYGNGCGVVFKLDTNGKETVLHSFTGGKDGFSPGSDLVMDQTGNLYGTAIQGGDPSCAAGGCGTVFKITP